MSQPISGQVGQQGPIASGTPQIAVRQGNYGELIATELNPAYYEQALRQNVFSVAQVSATAAIALAAGGATLVLFNPNNSGKNLALIDVVLTIEAQTAATQIESFYLAGAATGATQTLTTPLTPQPALVGSGATAQGKALVSSTFSNIAVPLRYIGSFAQAATATSGVATIVSMKDEIKGAIIVPPGSYVGIYGLTGGTVGDLSIAASMTWMELSAAII